MVRLGVIPIWAHTGMPAPVMARICSCSPAPFQFHCVCAGLLHDAPGIGQGLLGRNLIAHKGHVYHHEGLAAAPGHTAAIEDHLLQGNGEGVGVALHGHTQAVPHQDHVHPGLVHEASGGIVIAG